MKIKLRLAILLLCLAFSAHFQKTDAHILATNGNTSAVLHVGFTETDQAMYAGRSYQISFLISDRRGQFKMADCNCVLGYNKNGVEQSQDNLRSITKSPASSIKYDAVVSHEFPVAGNYTITLNGAPIDNSSFTPFKLSWHVSVKPYLTGSNKNHYINYFFGLLLIFLFVGITVYLFV